MNNFHVLSSARFGLKPGQFGDSIKSSFSAREQSTLGASGKMTLFIFPESQFAPHIFGKFAIRSSRAVLTWKMCKLVPPCCFRAERCILVPIFMEACIISSQNFFLHQIHPEFTFFYFSAQKPKIYQSIQILGIFLYKTYAKS